MGVRTRTGLVSTLNATAQPRRGRVWLVLLVLIAGLGAGSLFLLQTMERSPQPPHLDGRSVPPRARAGEDGVLRLAGAGPNLPLTRALVDAYVREHPEARIHVHESIGSSGGLQALVDGNIDIALVSRPLTKSERDLGVLVLPYATDAVVFAAHPSVPVDGLSSADAVELFAGARPSWPDGSRVVVLQREREDPKHVVAGEAIEGFRAADDTARRESLWHVMFSDDSIAQTLVNAPGSLALLNLGAAVSQRLPIKVLSLDGVHPDEASVVDGRYPLHVDLAFVLRTRSQRGQVAEFLRFVYSPEGEAVIQASGYIPMASEGLG